MHIIIFSGEFRFLLRRGLFIFNWLFMRSVAVSGDFSLYCCITIVNASFREPLSSSTFVIVVSSLVLQLRLFVHFLTIEYLVEATQNVFWPSKIPLLPIVHFPQCPFLSDSILSFLLEIIKSSFIPSSSVTTRLHGQLQRVLTHSAGIFKFDIDDCTELRLLVSQTFTLLDWIDVWLNSGNLNGLEEERETSC